jgi:hypothetical protein
MEYDKNLRSVLRKFESDPQDSTNALILSSLASRGLLGSNSVFIVIDFMNYKYEADEEMQWECEPECLVFSDRKTAIKSILSKMEMIKTVIEELREHSGDVDIGVDYWVSESLNWIDIDLEGEKVKTALDSCNDILSQFFPQNNFGIYYFEIPLKDIQ